MMRRRFAIFKYLFLLIGMLICAGSAYFSAILLERATKSAIEDAFAAKDIGWAQIESNGLEVFLYGTAPNETARFEALSTAGNIVDSGRIIDSIAIKDDEEVILPEFNLQAMRGHGTISLVGLIPTQSAYGSMIYRAGRILGPENLTDLLQTADYPAPANWDEAMRFVINALENLPQSTIELTEEKINIIATAKDAANATDIKAKLQRAAPEGYVLTQKVNILRPIISPYTARVTVANGQLRLDACTALNAAENAKIIAAAKQKGIKNPTCAIGLGRPDENWTKALLDAFNAIKPLQDVTITFTDRTVVMHGNKGQDITAFEKAAAQLQADLPVKYTLETIAPKPVLENGAKTHEFTATLSPEGLLQLRGDYGPQRSYATIELFAKSRFGGTEIRISGQADESLPREWGLKVMLALDALGYLENGAVELRPDALTLHGRSYDEAAQSKIVALLDQRFERTIPYDLQIETVEAPKPEDAGKTAELCLSDLIIKLDNRKINFEPGSARLDIDGRAILDDIADALRDCPDMPLQIAGHTDSQGRETMNQQLSKARAEAIVSELRARRILTQSFKAVGFGESKPIADNGTEEGREANRRIEFSLYPIGAETAEEPENTEEETAVEQPATSSESQSNE